MAALCVSDTEINVDEVMEHLKNATHYNDENFMTTVSTETSEKFGDDKDNVVLIAVSYTHLTLPTTPYV